MQRKTMILIPEYWHAVARGIDAETTRQLFSFAITRAWRRARSDFAQLIADHTPEPFKVQTGFVCYIRENLDTGEQTSPWMSRQYDLLIHDPRDSRPFYAIDQLVLCHADQFRCVVEVKSYLGKRAFTRDI